VIVLDTHVLVWADHDERQLGRKARSAIERAWSDGQVAVSAISFWEVGLLQVRGRYRPKTPVAEWRERLLANGLTEIALDGAIALRALDFSSFHPDPSDRFILATALEERAVLATADERLLAWEHPLERIDARK